MTAYTAIPPERQALLDFVACVVWPTRTLLTVTAAGGQQDVDVVGSWDTTHDAPMAWVNGQRVSGGITWLTPSRVRLPAPAAQGSQVIVFVSPGAGAGYLPRAGGVPLLGHLDAGGFRVINLAPSTMPHHAVRRDEVAGILSGILGGNYVLKAGSQMSGPLLLPAASLLTDAAAAVRRDMVPLRDGSQGFTQPVSGVAPTEDAHLITRGAVKALTAPVLPPNRRMQFSAVGVHSFTVPEGVTFLHALARGGTGGRGGKWDDDHLGGVGGPGAEAVGGFAVTPGQTVSITVGGLGGDGQDQVANGAGGGGGGGGSRVSVGASVVRGGGGGGGGGHGSLSGGNGGAGGQDGAPAHLSLGGMSGGSISDSGGAGGNGAVGAPFNIAPGNGSVGGAFVSADVNAEQDFYFTQDRTLNSGGAGLVVLRWQQP